VPGVLEELGHQPRVALVVLDRQDGDRLKDRLHTDSLPDRREAVHESGHGNTDDCRRRVDG